MAVGIRAARLAFIMGVMESQKNYIFSNDDYDLILFLIKEHGAELLQERNISAGNHGIFQCHGLLLISGYLDDLEEAKKFSVTKLTKIIDSQFTEEGIHTENSPEYHYFILGVLNKLKISEVFEGVMKTSIIKLAEENKFWFVTPDRTLAPFGDTCSRGPLNSELIGSKLLTSPIGEKYVLADFCRSGYIFCRSKDLDLGDYFAIACSGHTYVHKHADVGSFVLWHKGVEYFSDPGKYKYDTSAERTKFLSSSSHSIIHRKGKPISPKEILLSSSGTYCDFVKLSDDSMSFSCSVSFDTRKGESFIRVFNFIPPNSPG
jgi:acetyltransferase-like isoleucine patch superfamily enzyme